MKYSVFNSPFILVYSSFDIIHLGEQEILKNALKLSQDNDLKIIILMPETGVKNNRYGTELYSLTQRISIIRSPFVDLPEIIVVNSDSIKSLLNDIMSKSSNLKYFVSATSYEDYDLYHKKVLNKVSKIKDCRILKSDNLYYNNIPVSSKSVRQFLNVGLIKVASKILGRRLQYKFRTSSLSSSNELDFGIIEAKSYLILDDDFINSLNLLLSGIYFIKILNFPKQNESLTTEIQNLTTEIQIYGLLSLYRNKTNDKIGKNLKKTTIYLDIFCTRNHNIEMGEGYSYVLQQLTASDSSHLDHSIEMNIEIDIMQLVQPQREDNRSDRECAMKCCYNILQALRHRK